jgi:hypothetical protein
LAWRRSAAFGGVGPKDLAATGGVDGGDKDGERRESSTDGEGPALSRAGEQPRRRRRPRAVPRGGQAPPARNTRGEERF